VKETGVGDGSPPTTCEDLRFFDLVRQAHHRSAPYFVPRGLRRAGRTGVLRKKSGPQITNFWGLRYAPKRRAILG